MFYWQWFILVITVFFVVSNGGEGMKRRSFSTNLNANKRNLDIGESEKLSTNVKFPLWVSISGFGNIGVNTQFQNVSDNLYEFTLPFLVEIKESDVLVNRSTKQDKNLAFPFFVRVTRTGENKNKYANETTLDTVRLAFPFDLEVSRVNLAESDQRGLSVMPEVRTFFRRRRCHAYMSVPLDGDAMSCSCSVMGSMIGSVVLNVVASISTVVIHQTVVMLFDAAVEFLRPHVNRRGHDESIGTIIGGVARDVAGVVVSYLPVLGDIVRKGMKVVFQTFCDSVGPFVREILSYDIIGDTRRLIQLGYSIFNGLPFKSWSLVPVVPVKNNKPPPPGYHRPAPPGQHRPPPPVVLPQYPLPPPSEKQELVVIRIYYGQIEIPGYPDYIIVWPGTPEPPISNRISIRPIIPTLPKWPNIRLVWPIQSPTPLRPNIILVQSRQVYLLGYVNVIIVWPGQPEPTDKDITILRPNQETIPNIIGVRLLWPGQKLSQPVVIFLQPEQRQHPQFPTIIFQYPGDPPAPIVPGLTIVSPPIVNVPNYPSVSIIWPGAPIPPHLKPLPVTPEDTQIPQLPAVIINKGGKNQSSPQPGLTYISPGQSKIPGYPGVPLKWLPQSGPTPNMPISTVYIPPNATTVPGHPDCGISRPGRPSPNTPQTVNLGAPTLPNDPNVMLTWLELPTDLVLKPTPDIYNVNIQRAKRSIREPPAVLNDIDDGWTTEREILHGQETDFFEREYIRPNTTFYAGDLDVPLGHKGNAKVAHEKEVVPKLWTKHLHMSKLTQHVKQIFGFVCC